MGRKKKTQRDGEASTVPTPVKRLVGKESLPVISVETFLDEFPAFDMHILAGKEGLQREIRSPRIQKSGIALAGMPESIHPDRLQILGNTEISFLKKKSAKELAAILEPIKELEICCFLITRGLAPPAPFLEMADEKSIPVLQTTRFSAAVISQVSEGLLNLLAPVLTTHGVMVDVFGVGLLIIGEGSIGKSECALDLIVRGHRLVSDDLVEIRRLGETLRGAAPEVLRYHMELRGMGIINIKDLFGLVAATRQKEVDLVLELETWRGDRTYDRLGLDDQFIEILGVSIPYLLIPVAPGRNTSILIEVAVRNLLLKREGKHSAREFAQRLESIMTSGNDEG